MENKDVILIRKLMNLYESVNSKLIHENSENELSEEESLEEGREQAFKDLLMTFAKTEKEALGIFKNNPLFRNAKSLDDVMVTINKATGPELKEVMKTFIPSLKGSNRIKLLNTIRSSPAFKSNMTKALELSKKNPEVMREVGQYYRDMGIEAKELTNMISQSTGRSAKEVQDIMNTSFASASKMTQDAAKVTQNTKNLKGAAAEVKAVETGAKNGQEAANAINKEMTMVKELPAPVVGRFKKIGEKLRKYKEGAYDGLRKIKDKLSWKNLILYGLAGYGTYELFKSLFGDDASDEKMSVMPPCVVNLEGATWKVNSNGDPVIFTSVEFDEKSKGHGGLLFYGNNRVFTGDRVMRGSYRCKAGDVGVEIAEGQLNEQSSNIEITWDSEEKKQGDEIIPPKPVKSKYTNCNDKELPHEFGCRSEQVKKVQGCLGLPSKYQTGNFGPITKKALEEMGVDLSNGLTQGVVDDVCAGAPKKRALDMAPVSPERIKLADLAPSDVMSKKIDASRMNMKSMVNLQPTDFYNALKNSGLIFGEDEGNRIKYKGPDLDDEQLSKLDTVLSSMGYVRIKQLEDMKRYGSKYVWLKQ